MWYRYISILVVILGKALSCEDVCPHINGKRIFGDSIVVVGLNEDIIAPMGTVLVLDSTVRVFEQINICINRTSAQGASVHCWPEDDIVHDRNGFLVSEVEITQEFVNNSMYTWWSKSTGLLGDTTVITMDQSKHFTVFGKKSKAISLVFNLGKSPYVDVALLYKTNNGFIDVYNYQPQEGVMLCCSTLVHNIIPSHSGSLYMTTFQDIDCSLVEGYTFIATSVNGETVIRKFDVKLENKGDKTVNVTMSYKPYSPGHYAELVCTTLHNIISVSWTFNGRTLEDDRKYTISSKGRNMSILSISEVWRGDIGSYTCKVHSECDVANSSINISYGSPGESDHISIMTKRINQNNSLLLRCIVTGHIMSMVWIYKGRVIENDSKHNVTRVQDNVLELLIKQPDLANAGQYLCRCNTTRNVTLLSVVDILLIDQRLPEKNEEGTVPTTKSPEATSSWISTERLTNELPSECTRRSAMQRMVPLFSNET